MPHPLSRTILATLLAQSAFAGSITDLGAINFGNTWSALNNSNIVVGSVYSGNEVHAAKYENGTITDLGNLGLGYGRAFGISGNGQITGESALANGDIHAFLYANGTMQDLGTLGGDSSGKAVNNDGWVAGNSYRSGMGDAHAFLYDGTGMTDLNRTGFSSTLANGINNNGEVVGNSTLDDGTYHGFFYKGATFTYLGGLLPNFVDGVNDSGQLLYRTAIPYSTAERTSIYTPGGPGLTDIGTLGGDTTQGRKINASGQVVGFSSPAGNPVDGNGSSIYQPFLYSNGTMVNINDLFPANSGWIVTGVQDINDAGVILGSGTLNGVDHAFLFDPNASATPEPGTVLMMTGAILALGLRRRR